MWWPSAILTKCDSQVQCFQSVAAKCNDRASLSPTEDRVEELFTREGRGTEGEAFPCFHPLFPSGCVKSFCREEFQNHVTNVVQGFIKSYICFVNVWCYLGWNTFAESNPSQTMILIHGKHIEPRLNRQEYADVIIFFFKLQTNKGKAFCQFAMEVTNASDYII